MKSILDEHPRLAIPDESHFIIGLRQKQKMSLGGGEVSVEDIVRHPRFVAWEMDPQILRDHVADVGPRDYPELLAATFEAYAKWRKKERWGDKTPGYAAYMPYLQQLFPTALFIHMIRDGREVAASLADRPWGPRTAVGGAFWWRKKIKKTRREGARLTPGTYLEVRLDELIARPEETMHRVCDFLEEPYAAEMMDYPEHYRGKELPPGERHLVKPPTAGLRDWRHGLSKLDERAVEAVCRARLKELGYDAGPIDPVASVYAVAQRGREFILSAPSAVAARLRPATRSY
ncbi:MAG: hypothetical protein QOH90_2213 [Actinomycetota bacterium]|jgi:hypothetical protein|nr:hypothetical protein [Actinomycetota bacterium]